MWMPPGIAIILVADRKGKEIRIDPLHVVAIEEGVSKAKRNGKH